MSDDIAYPVGEIQTECAICTEPLEIARDLTKTYPNLVCWRCDSRAVNADGNEPKRGAAYREQLTAESDEPEAVDVPSDAGENPVFIDGHKCWRRYRLGGFVTRLDQFDCDSIWEFDRRHRPESD